MSQFFHRFFGRRAQVIHREKEALDRAAALAEGQKQWKAMTEAVSYLLKEVKALKEAAPPSVSKLVTRIDDLEEELSTTKKHLHKLRGQVHGPRGASQHDDPVSAIPFGDKESLRRAAGLKHGVRFEHPPEE